MKSLWKCFVQSAIVVGVSTCSTTTLVAQDAGPFGTVRVSQARAPQQVQQPQQQLPQQNQQTRNVVSGPVRQASQVQPEEAYAPPAPPIVQTPTGDGGGYPMVVNPDTRPSTANYAYTGWTTVPRQDLQNTNWRYQDWQASDTWGSGLRARTQAQSLAFEQNLAATPGTVAYNGPIGPVVCNHDPSGNAMIDYFKCKFGYFIPTGGGGKGVPWAGHYARVYPVNPTYSDPRDGQAYAAQGYGIPMAVPLAPVVGHTYEYGNGIPSSRLVPVSHPAY